MDVRFSLIMNNQPEANEKSMERLKYELEIKKYERSKSVEQARLEIERARLNQSRWDSLTRVLVGVVITSIITAAVTIYGIQQRGAETLRADANRKAEVLIQLINAREAGLRDLRARMFEVLMTYYESNSDGMSTVLLLELIGLNFRDTVQLKPVFERLNEDPSIGVAEKSALREAAKAIIKDQLDVIMEAKEGDVCFLSLEIDKPENPECFMPLMIERVMPIEDGQSKDYEIEVRTNVIEGRFCDELGTACRSPNFGVGYFDMPMIDYTIVSSDEFENWRYSLVLLDISAQKADIAVAVLPQDSYSALQPYKFDELLRAMIQPENEYTDMVEMAEEIE